MKGYNTPTGDYVKGGTERAIYRHPLNPDQFPDLYHGTPEKLKKGSEVSSPQQRGAKSRYSYTEIASFASPRSDYASNFGDHVYKVKPTGPIFSDLNDNGTGNPNPHAVMSFHPMQVLGKEW